VRSLDPSGVDLVERMEELNKGGNFVVSEGQSDLFADGFEVEWIAAATEGIHLRGPEGMVEGWRDWLTPYESYIVEAEDYLDAGDDVVILADVRAKTRRDGVVIEHSPASVWTIEDGKVVRIRFFLEREAALAATATPSHEPRAGLKLTGSED
jgi:ketosteroid isomerase-like protein